MKGKIEYSISLALWDKYCVLEKGDWDAKRPRRFEDVPAVQDEDEELIAIEEEQNYEEEEFYEPDYSEQIYTEKNIELSNVDILELRKGRL